MCHSDLKMHLNTSYGWIGPCSQQALTAPDEDFLAGSTG